LLIGRVPQHERAAADHHGNVRWLDVEVIERLLDGGIAVEVEHRVGMSVSREKLPDAECPLAMTRPEDHDVAHAASDQLHAPQDESAHEDIAQLAVGLDQCQQRVATDFDDFPGGSGLDPGEPPPARQQRHFTGELARAEYRLGPCAGAVRTKDLDPTLGDDEEVGDWLPGLHQHFVVPDASHAPMGRDARDLCRRQYWKELLGARGGRGDCWCGRGHVGRKV